MDNNLASSWMTSNNSLATTSFGDTSTLALYPNPVSHFLNINAAKPMSRIKIFDVSGQLIYDLKQKAETVTMDWSDYSNGIYFVSIYDENGFIIKKVIKQ
jgi:hypothetical protein